MKKSPRVLAILHGLIGDSLMRVPALRALREAHPAMELLAIADPVTAPALAINPLFDRVLAWDRRRSSLAWQIGQIRRLRSWAPDVALDFYFGSRTPWVARLSGAPRRIGPARGAMARRLLTDPLAYPLPADVHMLDRFAALVRPLGAGPIRHEWEFPIHAAVRERMLARVPRPQASDVVLVVGAGDESKRLAPDRMLEFTRELAATGRRVLLVQDRREPELGNALASEPGVEALPALDLPELGALFAEVGLVAVGDTGPLHVALGTAPRIVAWYQSTDPVVHASDRVGVRLHYREVCPLQPCDTREKHRCQLECTWSVRAEELVASVEELFRGPAWKAPPGPARDPRELDLTSL